MKPFRPTRRAKKRYIVVRFLVKRPQSPEEWAFNKIVKVLGIWGYSHGVRKIEEVRGKLLIIANREWADLVAGSLVIGREEFVPVTFISGTLNSLARKKFL